MEEVRRQMAESMPGTMDVFAQAYSEMTGSGLQGQEALAKFYEDIAKGGIKSADILPIVARILSERAAPKLNVMKKSSIAEQARMENTQTRLLETFSKSGGEQAFAKFFRIMADGLKANEPLVRGLTEAFSDLVTFMEAPLQLVKDFNAGLEEMSVAIGVSEGSLVKLGGLGVMLATKWGRVGFMFAAIAAVLQDLSRGIQGKNSYTKDVMDWVGMNSTPIEERRTDPNDPLGRKGPLADWWQQSVRPTWNRFTDAFSESIERSKALSDPNSVYYNDPKGYDAFIKDRQIAAMQDAKLSNVNNTNSFQFGDIVLQLPDGAPLEDNQRAQMFANMLQMHISSALNNFGKTQ